MKDDLVGLVISHLSTTLAPLTIKQTCMYLPIWISLAIQTQNLINSVFPTHHGHRFLWNSPSASGFYCINFTIIKQSVLLSQCAMKYANSYHEISSWLPWRYCMSSEFRFAKSSEDVWNVMNSMYHMYWTANLQEVNCLRQISNCVLGNALVLQWDQ